MSYQKAKLWMNKKYCDKHKKLFTKMTKIRQKPTVSFSGNLFFKSSSPILSHQVLGVRLLRPSTKQRQEAKAQEEMCSGAWQTKWNATPVKGQLPLESHQNDSFYIRANAASRTNAKSTKVTNAFARNSWWVQGRNGLFSTKIVTRFSRYTSVAWETAKDKVTTSSVSAIINPQIQE